MYQEMLCRLRNSFNPWNRVGQITIFRCSNDHLRNSSFELKIAANWKLAVENTSESYHLPWVHPGLNSASRLEDHYHILGGDSYCGQGTNAYAYKYANSLSLPRLPGINPEAAGKAEYITLFPNVQIGLHSDQLFHIIIEPISPYCTNERIAFYYLDRAAISEEFTAFRAENISWWRNVFSEDMGNHKSGFSADVPLRLFKVDASHQSWMSPHIIFTSG